MTDGQVLVLIVALIGLWSWVAVAAGMSMGREQMRKRVRAARRADRQVRRDLTGHHTTIYALDRASSDRGDVA